ncbi:undecaprenyldiphospho-muramoylpentapeptide beta-N-acetylglucosaminyltransferase [Ruminococcaceae bacterium OttesenSCG-928-I18]|nr:undecaprenyldiphospho-muramoylpentapeptide beta-N-acetylglucosaminyltransferase [Ruminococcaceae bacterium OttesenSCG-928-I18]
MRVLIAAGGTAGHINPALAIAGGIKERWPKAEIHFAGRSGGMEYGLVTNGGYPFHPIEVHGIQRRISPQNLVRNAKAAWYLARSGSASRRILAKVEPALVIGTGGYVSGPVVRAAARKGILTAIHEQNAFPGVTNRLLAAEVDRIYAVSQTALDRLGYPEKGMVTGNPVPDSLFHQDRAKARKALRAEERVVILSFGGSLGAQRVNEVVAELAAWHLKNRNFLHVHATGGIEKNDFKTLAQKQGIDGQERFLIREYIHDMPAMLAAADLVICRAGALTIAELQAVGRASVLIPSPNVAENHQYHNAMELAKAGAAVVFEEKNLSGEKLIAAVDELTAKPQVLREMGEAARRLAHPESLHGIIEDLARLTGRE